MNINSTKLIPLFLYKTTSEQEKVIQENTFLLKKISFLNEVKILFQEYNKDLCIKEIIDGAEIILPILQLVEKEKELKRLKKEMEKIEINIKKIKNKLANENFLSYAPEKIVTEEKNKLSKLNKIYQKFFQQIKIFTNLSNKK